MVSNSRVGAYAYPAQGPGSVRPHAPVRIGDETLTYDGNGNLVSFGAKGYAWDGENRLQSVSGSVFFAYGPDGERIAKRDASGTSSSSATTSRSGAGSPPPTSMTRCGSRAGSTVACPRSPGLDPARAEGAGRAKPQPRLWGIGEPRQRLGQRLHRGAARSRDRASLPPCPLLRPDDRPLHPPRSVGPDYPRRRHQPLRLCRQRSGQSERSPRPCLDGQSLGPDELQRRLDGGGGGGGYTSGIAYNGNLPGRFGDKMLAERAFDRATSALGISHSYGRMTDGVESVFQRVASSLFAGTVPARVLDPLTGIYYYTIEPTAPPVIVPPALPTEEVQPRLQPAIPMAPVGTPVPSGPNSTLSPGPYATGAVPIGPGRPTKKPADDHK